MHVLDNIDRRLISKLENDKLLLLRRKVLAFSLSLLTTLKLRVASGVVARSGYIVLLLSFYKRSVKVNFVGQLLDGQICISTVKK